MINHQYRLQGDKVAWPLGIQTARQMGTKGPRSQGEHGMLLLA
jgi:hypothetical protein